MLPPSAVLRGKLTALRDRLADELGPLPAPPVDDVVAAYRAFVAQVSIVDGWFGRRLPHAGPLVFQGAQGVLLDEWHGFHPYTTWSNCIAANADGLLAAAGWSGAVVRWGMLRTVTTRHGPGPLVSEDPALRLADPRNSVNPLQGAIRFGHFDAVAHRYALEVTGAWTAWSSPTCDSNGRSGPSSTVAGHCRATPASRSANWTRG